MGSDPDDVFTMYTTSLSPSTHASTHDEHLLESGSDDDV